MLSRTLFRYVFKDLLKIFMMSSGALAGIMSFGGLLRPLTREGLDAGQVGRMLTYFTPAMTTYSFPIAALFATAVVYGRLSADNELTAARSSGISLISLTIAGPALVLGLIVALVSLLFLCFIVPASTLKVEKVVYSNLAKLIAGRIERGHQISFQDTTVFAQEAIIPPLGSTPAGEQQVVLIGPTIVRVDRPRPKERDYKVPRDFYTASRATLFIDPMPNGEDVSITFRMEDGYKFPRTYEGAVEAGIAETEYGPITMNSPIKEDVKFMDVWRLRDLYADISQSKNISKIISEFVINGQRQKYFDELSAKLNGPRHAARVEIDPTEYYTLTWEGAGPVATEAKEMIAPAPTSSTRPAGESSRRDTPRDAATFSVLLQHVQNGRPLHSIRAAELHLFAKPHTDDGEMEVTIDLHNCIEDGVPRERYTTPPFTVPMSGDVKQIAGQDLAYYEDPARAALGDQKMLLREKTSLFNAIIAESNGRASFAISCLILVMAGCALGMMFKSGNFLTAFAVSFVPAILSITLIIAGQRTASHLPVHFNPANNSPLQTGMTLIWISNVVNLFLAVGLLWRLGRK